MNQQNNYNFLIQKKKISEKDYYDLNQKNKNYPIPQIIIPSDSPYETPPILHNNQNINNSINMNFDNVNYNNNSLNQENFYN